MPFLHISLLFTQLQFPFLYKFLIFNGYGKIGESTVLHTHTHIHRISVLTQQTILTVIHVCQVTETAKSNLSLHSTLEAPMLQSIWQPQHEIPGGSIT